MTNTKSTKRALILSVLSMLLCCSMLIGTTYAWFTDTVTSGGNKIVAGNLDIVLEMKDADGNWVDAEGEIIPFVAKDGRAEILWEPGCTYNLADFRVRNVGNLTAYVIVRISGIDGNEKLLEALEFTTLASELEPVNERALIKYGFDSGELDGKATLSPMKTEEHGMILWDECLMPAGQTAPNNGLNDTSATLSLSGHMKEEAGNEYQNLTIDGISITVIATQSQYEKDSFGSDYDKDAEYLETFVSDSAELKKAISEAKDGDIIVLSQDITVAGYAATEKLTIDKAITLDLNGHTLTTECGWGGIDAKGGCTIKNGSINHTGNTAAIKAFQVKAIENVTIKVSQTEGKVKGGIVVQEGAGCYVGSIKNVTITGATNGIETYRCGSRADLAIGSMENVTIDATDTGILLSAPIGTVTGCSIEGNKIGINMYLYGAYSVSINLVNSTVSGATGIYAHDEVDKTNPGSLTLTYDAATVINGGITQEFEDEASGRVSVN